MSKNMGIHGSCLVEMANGEYKHVNSIIKGDQVQTESGTCRVKCVARTKVSHNGIQMVNFPTGLTICDYHPIKYLNKWRHPGAILCSETVHTDYVYNFVLEESSNIIINKTIVICLGHGLTEDVAKDWFYGTEQIIEFLQSCIGWEKGIVNI